MNSWKLASAYVIGRGHISKDMPCQDRAYILKDEVLKSISIKKRKTKSLSLNSQKKIINYKDSFYGLSLADGAGSCKHSDIGAEFISKEILRYIHKNFGSLYDSSSMQVDLVNHIETTLTKITNENMTFKDLSSTLLFIAIKSNKFIIGHIGDGVIGMLDKTDNLKVVSKPDNGEFSNVTYFTTSTSYPDRLRLLKGTLKNSKGFVLMSDGSEESLYNKQTESLAEINKTLINWLKSNSEKDVEKALYDNLEQVIRNKTQDDCSIGVMRIDG
jgi:serine/threonine protein phosphatase PrpC